MYEAHANPLAPATDLRSDDDWAYAGWLTRAAASLIDTAILFGGFFAGLVVLGIWESSTGSSGDSLAGLVMGAFLIAVFLHDPICHGAWQQTLGKRAMGIAVAMDTGERVNFGRALWRHVAKLLLGIVPLLGLLDVLNPLSSKKKQTVHDAIASTIVVRTR